MPKYDYAMYTTADRENDAADWYDTCEEAVAAAQKAIEAGADAAHVGVMKFVHNGIAHGTMRSSLTPTARHGRKTGRHAKRWDLCSNPPHKKREAKRTGISGPFCLSFFTKTNLNFNPRSGFRLSVTIFGLRPSICPYHTPSHPACQPYNALFLP